MPDEQKILDDKQVAEIEARSPYWCNVQGNGHVSLTVTERDTLCQTVQALREDLKQGALCEECEQWENNEDGNPRTFMVCGACWNKLQETNTALREQLAQVELRYGEALRAGLKCRAQGDELRSRLVQAEKERDEAELAQERLQTAVQLALQGLRERCSEVGALQWFQSEYCAEVGKVRDADEATVFALRKGLPTLTGKELP